MMSEFGVKPMDDLHKTKMLSGRSRPLLDEQMILEKGITASREEIEEELEVKKDTGVTQ